MSENTCKKCNGDKYVYSLVKDEHGNVVKDEHGKDKGVWSVCDCFIFSSTMKIVEKKVGRVKADKDVLHYIEQLQVDRNIQVYTDISDYQVLCWVISYFWLKVGFEKSFQLLNISEIVKVYVQENETCTFNDLAEYDILVITVGLHEFGNNSLADLFLNLLEYRKFKDKMTWVIIRSDDEKVEFPDLYRKAERDSKNFMRQEFREKPGEYLNSNGFSQLLLFKSMIAKGNHAVALTAEVKQPPKTRDTLPPKPKPQPGNTYNEGLSLRPVKPRTDPAIG